VDRHQSAARHTWRTIRKTVHHTRPQEGQRAQQHNVVDHRRRSQLSVERDQQIDLKRFRFVRDRFALCPITRAESKFYSQVYLIDLVLRSFTPVTLVKVCAPPLTLVQQRVQCYFSCILDYSCCIALMCAVKFILFFISNANRLFVKLGHP
jgi:hypothetical protein